MKRVPVVSTNLKSVGYEPNSQVLEIEFIDGGVYVYNNVPPAVFQDFLKAKSHGTFFHANIKKAYEFTKVEPDLTKDTDQTAPVVPETPQGDINPVFIREELRSLRDRAITLSKTSGINPLWKRAYLRFASAADSLDAMIARSAASVEEFVEVSVEDNAEVNSDD